MILGPNLAVASFCKVLTPLCPFVYLLSVAAFVLQYQSLVTSKAGKAENIYSLALFRKSLPTPALRIQA